MTRKEKMGLKCKKKYIDSVLDEKETVTIRPSIAGLQNGDYKTVGKMLATMLLQEGPPLTIFTPSLATYLTTGRADTILPETEEIHDGHIRMRLREVSVFH